MTFRAMGGALLLSILPIAGCGTVSNLANQAPGQGGVIPFGGVGRDLACMGKAANGQAGFTKCPAPQSGQRPQVAIVLLTAADLPFSFVGDVVTWPYTAAYTWINQPVPVPPFLPPVIVGAGPTLPAPDVKDPDKKTPEKGKQGDSVPEVLPPPRPQPLELTPKGR